MNNHTAPTKSIRQMKADKLEEIRASKARIIQYAHETIHPSDTDTDHTDVLWNLFQSGTIIFNGISEGYKLIKQVRNFLREFS